MRSRTSIAFDLTALLSGLIFGFGLMLSGMADPAKVLGFLDLTGLWDPSLAFVMGGAIAVAAPAYAWAKRRRVTLLDTTIQMPATSAIDGRLVLGSATFGVGWGIAGFCPGPAMVGASAGRGGALIFTGAMLTGMALFAFKERRKPLKKPTHG